MNGRITATVAFSLIATVFAGCDNAAKQPATKTEPAHVDRHVEEGKLNRITLTAQAEQRLGIQLASVSLTEVQRRRNVGGEVILPPGRTIGVSAPIAGTLSNPIDGTVPLPGSRLEAGQAIFTFLPLLSAERDVLTPSERVRVAQTKADVATVQIEARRQIETAKVSVEAAQINLDRAILLLKNKAGSQRSVDDASAQLKLAQEALTTSEERYQFLASVRLDEQAGEVASWTIESPVAGVLQSLDATAGETVAAADTLFTVITTNRVWIRVPIYVGQLRDVDTTKDATVAEFGHPPLSDAREAKYVAAPPSANPTATTVDVFYELDNEDAQLYPGQKLAVTVPLNGNAKSLVVPFNAILVDVHGGQWVYEKSAEHVYARRRVSVEYVDGELAVLSAGPEPGIAVVTDGAAELFGTEFGVGH